MGIVSSISTLPGQLTVCRSTQTVERVQKLSAGNCATRPAEPLDSREDSLLDSESATGSISGPVYQIRCRKVKRFEVERVTVTVQRKNLRWQYVFKD